MICFFLGLAVGLVCGFLAGASFILWMAFGRKGGGK